MYKCIYCHIILRLCNSLKYVLKYIFYFYFVYVHVLICAHLIVSVKSWGHVSYPKPNGLPVLMKWNGMYLWMYVCISRDNQKYTEHPEHLGAEQETYHILMTYIFSSIIWEMLFNCYWTHLSNTIHWQFKPGDYLRTDRET